MLCSASFVKPSESLERVTAVINNQVKSLQSKGISAVALGYSAGSKSLQTTNVRKAFKAQIAMRFLVLVSVLQNTYLEHLLEMVIIVQLQVNLVMLNRHHCVYAVVMDEAHKTFDRANNYIQTSI